VSLISTGFASLAQLFVRIRSRLAFLAYREQFGIYLPFGKRQAIILGDMSNACLHPFFIHIAHTIGCHIHQTHRADFSLREMQHGHLALAYQTLQQMKEEDDPFIYGQAHHYLALSAVVSQRTQSATAYHEEAVKIVERNDLHILKDPGPMTVDQTHLEASEVLERAVFLGTLLHMEIVLEIFNAKKRTMCYAIEEEFRYRFPVCLSDLSRYSGANHTVLDHRKCSHFSSRYPRRFCGLGVYFSLRRHRTSLTQSQS